MYDIAPDLTFSVRVGDTPLPLLVWLPSPIPTKHLPIAVYIHGGAFVSNDASDIPPFAPSFARSSGVVLVSVNYRLAPQVHLGDALEDVISCIHWVRQHLQKKLRDSGIENVDVDVERMGVFGGSAGGWLSALVGARHFDFVKVLGLIYPMTNLSDERFITPGKAPVTITKDAVRHYIDGPVVVGAQPDLDYSSFEKIMGAQGRSRLAIYQDQEALWQEFILGITSSTAQEEAEAVLTEYDARLKITTKFTPTFVIHGGADMLIPTSNGVQMAEALEKAGVEHELCIVEGANHFFDMAPQSAQLDGIKGLWQFMLAHLYT